MNNYLLSIDPGLKDTGFVLGEKECEHGKLDKECILFNCNYNFKPIGVNNYNFEKFNIDNGTEGVHGLYRDYEGDVDIIIERGFNNRLNARSSEQMGALRGNIYGLFNKLYIPKENGILPRVGQNGYLKGLNLPNLEINIINDNKCKKGNKNLSINIATLLIEENNGNIDIKNNHNIADALLIGGAKINKEVK